MKIFRLYHKVDGYKAICTKGTKLEESLINLGNDVDFSKHEGSKFEWCGEESDVVCNFPFIDGSIPVLSTKAYSVIQKILVNCIMLTNIQVHGDNYIILDANLVEGVLNTEKSSIKYFKDGRVMNIKKYVFNSIDDIPAAFKIPECKTFTFVTEDVISALEESGITDGLNYELCDVE